MRVVLGAAVTTAAWAAVVVLLGRHTAVSLVWLLVGLWAVTTAVTWWVTRGGGSPGRLARRPVLLVVLAAAVVQLPGLTSAPLTSSDAYRYVWDGRVQLSGTSPYRYAPLDDRLAHLRDPVLFPGLASDRRSGYLTEPVPTDRAGLAARAADDPRTRINRPRVPTIYPPVAELWFTAVAAVTPWSAGTLGLQVGSAALAVGIAAALALALRRGGRDPRHALWWAWSPTVLVETGNGAHVDVVAAAVLVGLVLLLGRAVTTTGGRWLAGLLVGLAAAVKLFPLVVLPALMPLTRSRWREALPAPVAAGLTLLLAYLPHVLVAGTLVLGYLPGYLLEEGGASRSSVLRLLVPDAWLTVASALVLLAVAVWAVRRAGRGADAAVAVAALFGAFLLVSTPAYPWYAVPLVALAVLARRLEWCVVALAMQLQYAGVRVEGLSTTLWVVATLVVLGASGWRWRVRPRAVLAPR